LISKTAIKDYLNKQESFDDWSWVKNVSKQDLYNEVVKELGYEDKFKLPPFKHQLACLLIGLNNRNFNYFNDPGTGKTKIILDILQCRKKEWKSGIILSPNMSTVDTWVNEVKKHSDFTYTELVGKIEDRWKAFSKSSTDLVLLNYTGLLLMLTDEIEGKWVINSNKIVEFSSKFDVIVYDEIHKIKSYKSLTYKICSKLSKRITSFRYGLSGTPLNRDATVLWPIFYLIDLGETLGENLTVFRESFFNVKKNYWGGFEYKLKKELSADLNKRIANKSIRYTEEESNDLPEKTFIKIPVSFSAEAYEHYQKGITGIIESGKDLIKIKNAFIKLRQICSGYIEFKNEDEEKICIDFKDNNKLEVLVDLIRDIPEDSKVVVSLEFIHSGDLVCKKLKKEKIKFVRLYGGTKDKKDVKDKFLHDNKIRVLVKSIRAGSTGIDGLQDVANYNIYYELPISSIDYKQDIKRLHREGQKKKTFIYSLITKNSIEESIEKYLIEGADIFSAIIDGKIKLK
jgi:SNF2 family DNA or RNA helicase